MYGPPVDLSFKQLSNVKDALSETPRNGLRRLTKDSSGSYLSRSLRLSNNDIPDIFNLRTVINHFLSQPLNIGWLDLSFNKITSIEQVLCSLRHLRVLYLHGNGIWSLSDVDILGELPYLHTITLHGNPIEMNRNYRNHVIFALPQLKKMDFSAVTREDRVLANVWCHCSNRGKTNQGEPLVTDTDSFSQSFD